MSSTRASGSWRPSAARMRKACHGKTKRRFGAHSMVMHMSEIDRQRVAAVRTLETLGYRFQEGKWTGDGNAGVQWVAPEADAMHSMLVQRADALIGCTEGSADENELVEIGEAIEAYEAVRWPDGKVGGGKG